MNSSFLPFTCPQYRITLTKVRGSHDKVYILCLASIHIRFGLICRFDHFYNANLGEKVFLLVIVSRSLRQLDLISRNALHIKITFLQLTDRLLPENIRFGSEVIY